MFRHLYRDMRIFIVIFAVILLGTAVAAPTLAQPNEKELFLVAQKAFEDGFYDVAMRYIQQLQEQFPQTDRRVESNLLLGQCYFFKGQYLKAYNIFHELLKESAFKDATLYWLGETSLHSLNYKYCKFSGREGYYYFAAYLEISMPCKFTRLQIKLN